MTKNDKNDKNVKFIKIMNFIKNAKNVKKSAFFLQKIDFQRISFIAKT